MNETSVTYKVAPPAAVDAEISLLGSILLDQTCFNDVNMPAKEFYLEKHQTVFSAMRALEKSGMAIDLTTLSSQLDRDGNLQKIGGASFLISLFNAVPDAAHYKSYEAQVHNAFMRRKALHVSEYLSRFAYGTATETEEDLNRASEFLEEWRSAKSAQPSPITATWADLDGCLAPVEWVWQNWMPKGHVTIVASEPGQGKSALALRMAACFTRGDPLPDGRPFAGRLGMVLWCEAEAAQAVNLERAKEWGLPLAKLLTPFSDPLVDVNLESSDHRRAIEYWTHQDDIAFVVVDSLRGAHRGDENSSDTVSIVKQLARLARDSNKPILLTHHLRKRGQLDGEGITLDRLRGSSAITQMARTVWAIDEPNPASPEHRRLSVIKSNLGRFPEAIGLEIEEGGVTFSSAPERPRQETLTGRAADLLFSLLQHGPVSSKQIESESKGAGFSWPTVNRAKERLGIVSVRRTGDWIWSLPAYEAQ